MGYQDGVKFFTPDKLSEISMAYILRIQLPTLRRSLHEHPLGQKRADVYHRDIIAQLMISGEMPNNGTPDPF